MGKRFSDAWGRDLKAVNTSILLSHLYFEATAGKVREGKI
jgi:hypothetical protein